MVLALNIDTGRLQSSQEINEPAAKATATATIVPVAEGDRDQMSTRVEGATALAPTRPAMTTFASGPVPGPHAIRPEDGVLKDEHLGALGQSNGVMRAQGFCSGGGASPLCGPTSMLNAITKLRNDWGVPSPHVGQAEELVFALEHFLPMLGLDAHQDAVDHGFSSKHFERVTRAYVRDQLKLTPAIEWIKHRKDQMPAVLRDAIYSGMAVASPLSNHWILLGGPGPGDHFYICDPNYPRPMWPEAIKLVPGQHGPSLRSASYVYIDFLGIGAKGPAVEDCARVRWKDRTGVQLELNVAADGWARLSATHPSGATFERRDFVDKQLVEKLTRAAASAKTGALDATLSELKTAPQKNAREAIDGMMQTLLHIESPTFENVNFRIGDRNVCIEGGQLRTELHGERSQRALTGVEVALLNQAVRTAKLSPTRSSQLVSIPEHLPKSGDANVLDFALRVQSPRSKVHNCGIGFYAGHTFGNIGEYGEYRDRLEPLIRLVDQLSSRSE